jgi:hypothetical protein
MFQFDRGGDELDELPDGHPLLRDQCHREGEAQDGQAQTHISIVTQIRSGAGLWKDTGLKPSAG